jgi:hypothetical protein
VPFNKIVAPLNPSPVTLLFTFPEIFTWANVKFTAPKSSITANKIACFNLMI